LNKIISPLAGGILCVNSAIPKDLIFWFGFSQSYIFINGFFAQDLPNTIVYVQKHLQDEH